MRVQTFLCPFSLGLWVDFAKVRHFSLADGSCFQSLLFSHILIGVFSSILILQFQNSLLSLGCYS